MAQQVVADAVVFPQDEGIGSIPDDSEPWHSAGYWGGLAQMVGTSGYVHNGLTFSGHNAGNDQVDIEAGRCYVLVSGVSVQSTVGGDTEPSHDTVLPSSVPVMLVLPSKVENVDLQDSTASDIWVAYDTDGTGPGSAGSVYVRSDDTGMVSAPSHPSVKLGAADPDDSSNDTRANDESSETFKNITLAQDVDDGTDRIVIENAAGTAIGEVYTDGTDTIFNAVSGDIGFGSSTLKDIGAATIDGLVGVPLGNQESGSPYTATGASSANSINPSGLDSFDLYYVIVKATDQASNAANVDLQVDGITGTNYFEIQQDGTRNTSQNEFGPIMTMTADNTTTGFFTLFNQNGVGGFTQQTRESSTTTIMGGSVGNITWPPSQFTLKRGQDTDWEVRIWGRDL